MIDERWNFDVFDEYIFRCNADRVRRALEEKNYPQVYAALRKQEEPFTDKEACDLCYAAITADCTAKSFASILEKCPPVEQFRYYAACSNIYGHAVDIVGLAAKYNREDLLKMMLEQGIDINNHFQWCSILEAAMEGGALDCVELMLAQDGLEIPITEQLLYIWGDAGRILLADTCYASVASRIFGCQVDLCVEEVPILPEMTINHALVHDNWHLFRRICKQNGVSRQAARNVLPTILHDCRDEPMENLDALLTACPELLKHEVSRCELVTYALKSPDEVDPILKKWIDRMPGRMVVLNHLSDRPLWGDASGLTSLQMESWKDKIGDRLVPALSRNYQMLMLAESFWEDWDGFFRWAMKYFYIKGKGKKGAVSRLAKNILLDASPAVVVEMLENDFVLNQEDPEAMMAFCKDIDALHTRYVLAACMKKENVYEL